MINTALIGVVFYPLFTTKRVHLQTPVASIEAIRIDCDSIIERHTVWSHEQPFAAIGDFFAADVSKGLRVFATWTESEYSSTIIYFRLIHANNGSRSNVGIAGVENDEAAKANNEYSYELLHNKYGAKFISDAAKWRATAQRPSSPAAGGAATK